MRRLAAISAVIFALGIGSAVAQPPPPAAPPPPRYEAVPPPRGHMMWEPGHWHWDGVRYVWMGGRYIERHPGWAHYVPGRWVWRPEMGRWTWVPEHWGR